MAFLRPLLLTPLRILTVVLCLLWMPFWISLLSPKCALQLASSTTPDHQDMPTPRNLPLLLTVVYTRVPTLQHILKVLRNVWAGLVMDLLSLSCARPTDLEARAKLFVLAKYVLVRPYQRGRCHWRDMVRIFKDRIRGWKARDLQVSGQR